MRGKTPVGKSSETEFNILGKTGGAKTHILTIAEMPTHSHRLRAYSNDIDSGWLPNDSSWFGSITEAGASDRPNPPMRNNGGVMETTGGGSGHNNLQPYNTVNYIIKL